MYLIYSILLTIAFVLMTPLFLLRRDKYAAGFWERLGYLPEFKQDDRKVIWLHCVSVGETNAARPLVDELKANFPDHRLIFSTTTKTGQELAKDVFNDKADAVFYFAFDWKFSVRRALRHFKPDIVLLMETEIWPRFIREAKLMDSKVAIINGRLSQKSFAQYSRVRPFVSRVLADADIALMQSEDDARRIESLGMAPNKIKITGNIKFDLETDAKETALTETFRNRFGISPDKYLIVAASTHSPEEKWIVEACRKIHDSLETKLRLLIAPRHPQRFDEVAAILKDSGFSVARRSDAGSESDKIADIILFDSIGELRAVYPLATIVFMGGSLIPHGGQSVLEPAAAGKAIITGPFTHNFEAVVKEFLERKALIQLQVEQLSETFEMLLRNPAERDFLGSNALAVMKSNRGATAKTVEKLKSLL